MKPIRAVAFDLEGTAIDVEDAHHQAHILAAKEMRISLTLDDCFKKIPHFIGGPDERIAFEIASLAGVLDNFLTDKDSYDEWVRKFLAADKKHYEEQLGQMQLHPRTGLQAILERIRLRNLPAVIGSLTLRASAEALLEGSGLLAAFKSDLIVFREDVKSFKPAPDVWIESAKRAGVGTDELLVFEDSPRGIRSAISVGASCVGIPVYNRPDTVNALVTAGASRIFMDWREMNIDALIENLNAERVQGGKL